MKPNFKIIGAILRKDFLSLYPLVLLVTGILVADVFIVRLELMAAWLSFQQLAVGLPVIVLTFSIFQLDAPVSLVDDWLCRPVPKKELLIAKFSLVFVVIYVSRVIATFIADQILGYGLAESLLEALLLQDRLFQIFLPFILMTGIVTSTVIQGMGAFIGLFLLILIIPAGFMQTPGPLEPDFGETLSENGMVWLLLVTAKTLPLLLMLLCFWMVYVRKQIAPARGVLAFTALFTPFLLFIMPTGLLPWDVAFSLQAATLSRADAAGSQVIERIALRNPRSCFPAARISELASNSAFGAAAQFSGLGAWEEEDLQSAGPGAITFLTGLQPIGLPLDWRVKMDYVEASYRGADTGRLYELRPAVYITDNGSSAASGTLSHSWLLPEEALRELSKRDDVTMELEYSLTLLKPVSFELETDGVRRHLPGLGNCSASVDALGNRIDVDCFSPGSRPAQISAELIDIPGSRVLSLPDFAPGLVQSVSSERVELAIASPRLADHSRIKVTAWQSAGFIKKSWSAPGILGADTASCPLPSDELNRALQRSRWRDAAPHEPSYISVDDGVQLEVLDFGGDGTALVLLPGLGSTAHLFDTLAPRLAEHYRVFAITRRGVGDSSKPDFGYDTARLSQDVIEVMDALALPKALLVGASIAGEELTWLGAHYPERIHGLVYLDAAYDRSTKLPDRYRELNASLPPAPPPRPGDVLNYEAMTAYLERIGSLPLPEGELIAFYNVSNPYLAGVPDMDLRIADAIEAGIGRPDYGALGLPALALYAGGGNPFRPWYDPDDARLLATLKELGELAGPMRDASIERFRSEVRNGQVVVIEGGQHAIFLSNQEEVLQWIDDFATGLGL